jgi:hypothetical protein
LKRIGGRTSSLFLPSYFITFDSHSIRTTSSTGSSSKKLKNDNKDGIQFLSHMIKDLSSCLAQPQLKLEAVKTVSRQTQLLYLVWKGSPYDVEFMRAISMWTKVLGSFRESQKVVIKEKTDYVPLSDEEVTEL